MKLSLFAVALFFSTNTFALTMHSDDCKGNQECIKALSAFNIASRELGDTIKSKVRPSVEGVIAGYIESGGDKVSQKVFANKFSEANQAWSEYMKKECFLSVFNKPDPDNGYAEQALFECLTVMTKERTKYLTDKYSTFSIECYDCKYEHGL